MDLETFRDKVRESGTAGNKSTYHVDFGEKHCVNWHNTPCLSSVVRAGLSLGKPERIVFWTNKLQEEYQRTYGNFILNENWLSHTFLTKDLEEGLSEGFEMNMEISWQEIFAGISLIRELMAHNIKGKILHGNPEKWEELGASKEFSLCLVGIWEEGNLHVREPGKIRRLSSYGSGHGAYSSLVDGRIFNKPITKDIITKYPPIKEVGFSKDKLQSLLPIKEFDVVKRVKEIKGALDIDTPFNPYTLPDGEEVKKYIIETALENGSV